MTVAFFLPLSVIALYEANLNMTRNKWMAHWLAGGDAGEADEIANRDPELDGELQITKVPFEQLVKLFPNTREVRNVKFLFPRVTCLILICRSLVKLRSYTRSTG